MKLKIAICTPCFGGLLSDSYLVSAINTTRFLIRENVDHVYRTIANESLIQRARNDMANFVLNDPTLSHCFFIDADTGWTVEDFARIVNANKLIVGGTYPLKAFPLKANFNLTDEHITKYGHDKDPAHIDLLREEFKATDGIIPVRHLPTGFMMINRVVFEHLKDKVDTYVIKTDDGVKTMYNFFPVIVNNNVLESEDWRFCSLAREHGIQAFLDLNVVVDHCGTHRFSWPKKAKDSSNKENKPNK